MHDPLYLFIQRALFLDHRGSVNIVISETRSDFDAALQCESYRPGYRVRASTVRYVVFYPAPPHVLMDFVVLPPGHGRSVTDF